MNIKKTTDNIIPAIDFKVIHFYDKQLPAPNGQVGREVILLYALGADGTIREYTNGKWVALPIDATEAAK